MKTKFLSFCAVFMALSMSFVSCKKEIKTEEPDPVVADIYFSVQNGDYCYYIGKGASATAELTVVRENSSIADEYAIKVISADEGVEIPEKVSFKEGETQTVLQIKGPAQAGTCETYSFEIMFTGDNVNPSANSIAGTTRCEGSFYFYEEITGAGCFVPWSGTGDIYSYMGDIRQTVWKLDECNYIFKNFLGSKYDLKVILNSANNYIQTLVYGYELHPATGETGTEYYFYNETVEEFSETEGWEQFSPKGESRVITGITLYLDSTSSYSAFVPATESNSAYFYFACPQVYFYIAETEVEKSFTSWQYFCVYLYNEDKLAKCDFVGFPEIEEKALPEPVYSEDEKDGKIPFQFYLDNEQSYLDTQYATITDRGYVFEDFMMSETNLTLIPNGSTFTFEVTDAEGNVLSNNVADGYRNLGMDYIFPWASNEAWCIYGLQVYDDSNYCIWNDEEKSASFYGYYNIFSGDKNDYLGAEDGYINIYW